MTRRRTEPGIRDRRAELIPGPSGAERPDRPRRVLVIGGGIAGLAAATGLVERGIEVELVEPQPQLGGRVRSWPITTPQGPATMGRGFHAFFRQYYNLRALLRRLPPEAPGLVPVPDYPLISSTGLTDSFRRIPRTPPFSFIGFVLTSPSFRLTDLPRVDLDAALSLLDVDFPDTFRRWDGVSAQRFLDGLGFPQRARHLALEVFARSFFADPRDFSAGELVAMFHTYFLGSAEGLLFDTAADDFDTALWAPLRAHLEGQGVRFTRASAEALDLTGPRVRVGFRGAQPAEYDAAVIAAGPEGIRRLGGTVRGIADEDWRTRVAGVRTAPPFAVWRLWLDRPVHGQRPAFLGTTGYGPLDNISVLERFEAGAARWRADHGGSVIELHAYALSERTDPQTLRARLRRELARVWPETAAAGVIHEELRIERDCPLIGLEPWERRPTVTTPDPRLMLAGDCLRTDLPVALMERAATTGWQAANALLEGWGVHGHDLHSPPRAARAAWPGWARRVLRTLPGAGRGRKSEERHR
ncbi:FAD-dependent oxidoreductase [Rothia kristinae]